MAAFFTSEQIALLEASTVRCDLLVKFDFVGETVRVWNGDTELVTSDSATWLPMYGTGQVDGIRFSAEASSQRMNFALDGVAAADNQVLALALSETDKAEGQLVTVYLQLFGDDWQPVGAPLGLAFGYMQKPKVSRSAIDGVKGSIQRVSIAAENIFYNRSLPPAGRYTDRDQQGRSSGDLMCQFVPGLVNKNFVYPDY
tara:strand:- start:139 stop:735 length:597 start_codon:yes stop_codon:yes gene_type:complete